MAAAWLRMTSLPNGVELDGKKKDPAEAERERRRLKKQRRKVKARRAADTFGANYATILFKF